MIDDPHDCSIDGSVFASGGHSRRTALDNENLFAKSGVHRIDRDDVALLVFAMGIHQLADKKRLAFETRILARSDNSAGNASEKHDPKLLRALIHIKGGRLIDPKSGVDAKKDVYVAAGKIASIGEPPGGWSANRVIDAAVIGVVDRVELE